MSDAFAFLDLTKSLDGSFPPYSYGRYSDPAVEVTSWSAIERDGFRVDRLSLGTQSGTHIDAPAHFLENGACLDALRPEQFMGRYLLVDLPEGAEQAATYGGENIVFLRAPKNCRAIISPETMGRILSWPPALLVVSGEVAIAGSGPFAFHRLVAEAGKFLAEGLDERPARDVPPDGEIFVFPLRLAGTSGSPCRIVVRVRKITA